MAAELFSPPSRALDANASPYSGAKWTFTATGTTTPLAVFADADLNTSLGSTVTADAGGKFAAIYFDSSKVYRGVCKSADGSVTLHDIDPINSAFFGEITSSSGASIVNWLRDASGAIVRSVADWFDDDLSVMDFIPLVERVKIRLRTSTADVSYAFEAALTASASRSGQAIKIPSGLYFAYLVIEQENVALIGAGSSVTTIKVPDGASHTITIEAGPATSVGVPCVIDFGQIGAGNSAVARSNAHLSGLTLDGNKANTTPPLNDLHGWCLAFTKYSGVTYDDLVCKDGHAGGIGTFINSNYHRGTNWQVSNCGFNLGHPGFDVNSSKYSVWSGVVDTSKEGARLLDNCRNNSLDVSIIDCDRTGFIYDNQLSGTPGGGNFSENNDIVVRIDGGCSVAGVQVGPKCASGTLVANIANCEGYAVHEVKQTNAADNARGIHYKVASIRGAVGSCKIGGDSGIWDITTMDDGQPLSAGTDWAVNVFGDKNVITVAYQDSGTKLRGIQFNAGADGNKILGYTYTNTVQALLDSGSGNKYPSIGTWTAGTGTASRGAFAAAAAPSISNPPTQAEVTGIGTRLAAVEARLLALETDVRSAGVIN